MDVRGDTRRVGRYVMYGELAAGGMATVHLGRLLGPVGFSRTVAIKSLHPEYAKDPEFVAQFLDEARLAARIRHPNVVSTLDVVALKGELFLVMDYVQGETLSHLLRAVHARGEKVPVPIAIAVVAGVLLGLHAAHEAKNEHGEQLDIVHRDVSPQNIIVGVDGVARVLDFGVAKAAERLMSTTREGTVKGKIGYMAPEQLRAQHVNRQTDIYAASVVLWETLTSQRLFVGDDAGDAIDKVLLSEIAPPSRLTSGLPAALDRIVMRGLARERSERFSTAREMAVAMQTLGFAAATEVGEWVEAHADESLDKRARWIEQIEADSAGGLTEANRMLSAGLGAPAQPASPPAGPRSVRKVLGAPAALALPVIGALVTLGVAFIAALARGPTVTPAASAPPSVQSSAASAPPTAEERATTADSSKVPPGARIPPRPRTSPRSPCDPPYTLSSTGRKTYKRNCL